MGQKQVLFVDDDDQDQYSFRKAAERWNDENKERQFIAVTAKNVAEAHDHLRVQRFDCALFDLKLSKGGGAVRNDGNDLVRLGLSDYGIPVGIISSNPQDIDADLKKVAMLKTFDKGDEDPYGDALAWLAAQWPMMDVLADSRSEIRRTGAAIFRNRIWSQWANYEKVVDEDRKSLTQIVARQYAGQIAEHLGVGAQAGWHPFEHYIQPAMLEDRAQTGDIFEIDDARWVVLTPACDLATKKAPIVLLAHCREGSAADGDPLKDWDMRVAQLKGEVSNGQKKDRDVFFRSLVNQALAGKHFLPPIGDGKPMLVEFKSLKTLSAAELDLTKRLASIAPAFVPNLVQRFGAYISRTGQPNIEVKHFA
jgi:CheY-like chemotaxis protein